MNKVKITYQSYGSAILLYIEGATPQDANGQYLSMWNWNCTSSNPDWITKNVLAVWSSVERLKKYLLTMRQNELEDTKAQVPNRPLEAKRLAELDFAGIGRESYRSVNNNTEVAEFGTPNAEREDLDFKDECYKAAFAST
jgi:hypothetical protein